MRSNSQIKELTPKLFVLTKHTQLCIEVELRLKKTPSEGCAQHSCTITYLNTVEKLFFLLFWHSFPACVDHVGMKSHDRGHSSRKYVVIFARWTSLSILNNQGYRTKFSNSLKQSVFCWASSTFSGRCISSFYPPIA
ncbi:hypothetical protein I3842_04G119400 [Carya illinoinensis]|uniref:Uncharacterized protein n=1 Tax=Carya illinoinensis TaxID=32201 RepID=A0A922JRI4_CARIL|nr:hypothetical protein I3842_04G119400 [Carya illinoinensis]